jgi:DNA repair/transcription protein MET18/MMS19
VDVLACYFPITYSPPAGGADVIAREQLVAGVAAALAAAPAFAPHAMPLVLEKLGSSLRCAGALSLTRRAGCLPRRSEVG